MSDMSFLREQVKDKDLYRVCMAGWVVAGGITGSFVPAAGTAAGAVGGLVWGLLTCGPLSRMAAEKFLRGQGAMTQGELRALAGEMSRMTGVTDPDDLLRLLAAAREAYRTNPAAAAQPGSPRQAAAAILSVRGA